MDRPPPQPWKVVREALDVPEWVPAGVVKKIHAIETELNLNPSCPLYTAKCELLRWLVDNEKMKAVWAELRSCREPSPRHFPPDRTEFALGLLFDLVFQHTSKMRLPGHRERIAETLVIEPLRRLQASGGGELDVRVLAYGSGKTAPEAFASSVVLIMFDLFGSPHWRTVATLASVSLGCEVTVEEVRTRRLRNVIEVMTKERDERNATTVTKVDSGQNRKNAQSG
jgi:hypothetical protein